VVEEGGRSLNPRHRRKGANCCHSTLGRSVQKGAVRPVALAAAADRYSTATLRKGAVELAWSVPVRLWECRRPVVQHHEGGGSQQRLWSVMLGCSSRIDASAHARVVGRALRARNPRAATCAGCADKFTAALRDAASAAGRGPNDSRRAGIQPSRCAQAASNWPPPSR
jgi:hypothetical protein